jgi:hypothetical protein
MATAELGFQNWINSGTITDSSHASGMPASGLTGPVGYPGWQTGASTTAAYFSIDAGAAVTWDIVGLFRTNLTAAATVQILLGSTVGASDIYSGSANLCGVAAGYLQSLNSLGATYLARYAKVIISDSANPDGCLKIGLAYAGPLSTPSNNFDYGDANGWQDDTTFQISKGGQEYPVSTPAYREATFLLQNLTEAEKFDLIMEMDRLASITGNVLFIPNPGSTYTNREAIFGHMKKSSAPTRPSFGGFSKAYDIRERL